MRHGFKIFDSDTHLNPSAETLEPYLSFGRRRDRDRLYPGQPPLYQ